MIDTKVSLVQLQTFVAVAQTGSFSAAARSLGKAQSAVSHAVGQLEQELDVALFDRSSRIPVLTAAGQSLLIHSKDVLRKTTQLKSVAAEWSSSSREMSLSLVVDLIYPVEPLVRLIAALRQEFPSISLTVHTEARGAVTARLLDESVQLGVTGLLLAKVPTEIETIPLGHLDLVAVVAAGHALSRLEGPIPLRTLRKHTQLVLDDRSQLTTDQDVGVVGAKNWKIGNQVAKRRFLLEGFGWGAMAWHEVEDDVAQGNLVCFQPASWSAPRLAIPFHIIHRSDRPPGEVARFAIEFLRTSLES